MLAGCNSNVEERKNSAEAEVGSDIQPTRKMADSTLTYADYERRDSIDFALAEHMILDSINKYNAIRNLEMSWNMVPTIENYPITAQLISGRFFDDREHYYLIRLLREPLNRVLLLKKSSRSIQVVVREQDENRYWLSDSIFDVNGDGKKDFVSYWYGKNGCCLKGFALVNLYRPRSITFTGAFDFINPTFYPSERIIRGITYGHPGDNDLYKYRWRGERLDTVEYISFQRDTQFKATSQLIRKRYPNIRNAEKLSSLPSEYRSIENLSWFLGGFLNPNNDELQDVIE